MHNSKFQRVWLLLLPVLTLLMPTLAFAQEGTPSDGAGAAITMALIGLIIVIVAFVIIIAAVSLGIILIGAAVAQGGDD